MIGELVGNYRITRLLGEGGMGAVYEAVHQHIERRAAIKILRPEVSKNPESANRFFNEARAVNIIEHPGIVEVHELGNLADGRAYLVMELLRGESLTSRLKRNGRLATTDTLRLGRQIASALAAAHAKSIVHRDLKPDNVMIVPDQEASGGERAKILDFGIAKLQRDAQSGVDALTVESTGVGVVLGTPAYMSPEQCKGTKDLDDRSDTYSLGVMLFRMATGNLPFVGDTALSVMFQHTTELPPRLRDVDPSQPEALSNLVAAMLAKVAAQRPTMRQVESELTRIASNASDIAMQAPVSRNAAIAMPAVSLPLPVGNAAAQPAARVPFPQPPPAASATGYDHPQGWWWYDSMDLAEIMPRLQSHGARPSRLGSYVVGTQRRFAVVMVKDQAPAWWWFVGIDAGQLAQKLAELGARVADQDSYSDGVTRRYQAVLIKHAGKSWWYPSLDSLTVEQKCREHGARIADLDTWKEPAGQRFSVTLVPADGEQWWWYPSLDVNAIGPKLVEHAARPVCLKSYLDGKERKFAVAMVRNTSETWWYQVGVDAATVSRFAQENRASIVDLDPYLEGSSLRFAAVFYKTR